MKIELWNGTKVTLLGQCVPYEFKIAFWEEQKFKDKKFFQSRNRKPLRNNNLNVQLKENMPSANFQLYIHLKQDKKEKWLDT